MKRSPGLRIAGGGLFSDRFLEFEEEVWLLLSERISSIESLVQIVHERPRIKARRQRIDDPIAR